MRQNATGVVVRLPRLLPIFLSLVLPMLALRTVHAAPPAIPDDWFFDGANRPAALKALEGKPAPALELESWIGSETRLSDQRGKVVVIDFWATWCGPCMAAIPENVEMVEKHKDDGLVLIGVHDANAGFDRAAQVVKDKKINYPVAKDKGGASTKNYALQFWPTYVVVDREGMVRAAGLIPSNVPKVVEMLLKEAAPAGGGAEEAGGGLPADNFVGGRKRPASLKALEGSPMPPITAREWLGAPVAPEAMKGSVVAVHFTAAGGTMSMRQLAEFAKLEKDFASQGVVFVVVCEAKADPAKVRKALDDLKSTAALAVDREAEAAPTDAKTAAGGSAEARGVTARAFGARFLPATALVDRSGKVRAGGVKPDKCKAIIESLLAEEAR